MPQRKTLLTLCIIVSTIAYLGIASLESRNGSSELDSLYEELSGGKLETSEPNEILRRLSLHLRGTIPDAEESLLLEKDPKQFSLDEVSVRYLKSSDFAEYWGIQFASLFREMTHRRKEVYAGFYKYIATSLHEDKPYDRLVREMLTATGSVETNPALHFYARDAGDPLQIAEYVGRLFYAKRVGCSRCHDDKFDPSFTQRDYYALAAFFSQQFYRSGSWEANRFAKDSIIHIPTEDIERLPLADQKLVRDRNNEWQRTVGNKMNQKQKEEFQKKHELQYAHLFFEKKLGIRFPTKDDKPGGDLVVPKFLDGTTPKISPDQDRRVVFVDWLVSRENPRFRKAIINRIWKELVGWAFFTPEDDWSKDTIVKGEPILNHLDEYFFKNDHSIKQLIYYIVNSQAYSRRNPRTDSESKDVVRYFPSKRLNPDQLINAIVKSSYEVEQPRWMFTERAFGNIQGQGSKTNWKGIGKLRFPDKSKTNQGHSSEMERPPRPNHFLAIFGSGPRMDIADDRSDITIDQILTLMNGRLIGKASWEFGGKGSRSEKTFQETGSMGRTIGEIYTILLGRPIRDRELDYIQKNLPKGDEQYDRSILQDWVWSLLNSQEFLHVN